MGFWLGEEHFLCVSIGCLSVFSPEGSFIELITAHQHKCVHFISTN